MGGGRWGLGGGGLDCLVGFRTLDLCEAQNYGAGEGGEKREERGGGGGCHGGWGSVAVFSGQNRFGRGLVGL